jgi:RNase P/RNase MRP subunit POP5
MDNFKRRRYVKFKIESWNRVARESFASRPFRFVAVRQLRT